MTRYDIYHKSKAVLKSLFTSLNCLEKHPSFSLFLYLLYLPLSISPLFLSLSLFLFPSLSLIFFFLSVLLCLSLSPSLYPCLSFNLFIYLIIIFSVPFLGGRSLVLVSLSYYLPSSLLYLISIIFCIKLLILFLV